MLFKKIFDPSHIYMAKPMGLTGHPSQCLQPSFNTSSYIQVHVHYAHFYILPCCLAAVGHS